MKVYRLENEIGGILKNSDLIIANFSLFGEVFRKHFWFIVNGDRNSLKYRTWKQCHKMGMQFGCKSKDQLRQYFGDEMYQFLIDNGWYITELNSEHMVIEIDKNEVAFI